MEMHRAFACKMRGEHRDVVLAQAFAGFQRVNLESRNVFGLRSPGAAGYATRQD